MKKQIFKKGVFLMISATSLEMFAWGFSDPFISIFAENILHNLFHIGLIFSLKNIVSILTVIFIAHTIKEFSARNFAILGKLIILVMSCLYFLAGVKQSGFILILALLVNGFSTPLRIFSNQDFLIHHTNKKNASTIMGIDFATKNTLFNMGAIMGGFFIFYLGKILSANYIDVIHYTYLILLPFNIIAIFLLMKLPKPKPQKLIYKIKKIFFQKKVFKNFFGDFLHLSLALKFSIILFFLLRLIERMVLIFVPLLAMKLDMPIWQIGILVAALFLPYLFSFVFSLLADKIERMSLIIFGLLLSIVPLIFLSIVKTPLWIGLLSALISLCLSIIQPANLGIIASLSSDEERENVAALQVFFRQIGIIFGSIILGYIAEKFGLEMVFIIVAIKSFIFAIIAIIIKIHTHRLNIHHKHNKKRRFLFHKILHHVHIHGSKI